MVYSALREYLQVQRFFKRYGVAKLFAELFDLYCATANWIWQNTNWLRGFYEILLLRIRS